MPKNFFWEASAPRVELSQVSGWTIPAIIRERSRREPGNAVYAVYENGGYRHVTWQSFGRMMAEIAAGLWHLGFKRGDRSAVMGDAALEWVASDFGSLGAGGICVGIYQTSSVPEVAHILGDAGPTAFFGQRKEHLDCGLRAAASLDQSPVSIFVLLEGEIPNLDVVPKGARVITLADLRRAGAEALSADPTLLDRLIDEGASTDLARIIYTSGTTGRPKGVMYTHEAWLLVGEQWVLRYSPIRDRQHRTVSFLSTAHVASAMVTEIVPLVSKLLPHFAPARMELVDVFRTVRPEVQGMTPRFFQKIAVQLAVQQESGPVLSKPLHRLAMRFGRRIVHSQWEGKTISTLDNAILAVLRRTIFRRLLATVGLDHLRRAQTGSAMMAVEVATLWAVWGIDIREAYGLSEAACAVAFQQEPFPRPGTIGKLMVPQPGTELELASDGEILFKSPMVFAGYWNAPEATAKALQQGWFYTGDIAERLPDGNLRLIGRKNDAISTAGGKTINPAEIENELKLSPYISEAIVFGHGEKYLTALIEFELASVAAWAKEKGLGAETYPGLAEHPEVAALIDEQVNLANKNLGRALQIKKCRIVPLPLDNVKDALTSAKKVKRRVIREQFHDLIESMYDRSEDRILAAGLKR
jgi:long-chain acyl-CoA synthetase